MKLKYRLYGIFILTLITIILISGCVQQEEKPSERANRTDNATRELAKPMPIAGPPYKSLWTICQYNPSIVEEAKRVNANTIWPVIIFGFDEKGGVVWKDPNKIYGCAKLIAKAHENGLNVIFSPITPGSPPTNGTFNKDHFIQTSKEMIRAYASFAEENNAQAFIIATELDTFVSYALSPTGERLTTELLREVAKPLISEARSVYNGEIGIGLVSISDHEEDKPYYPFEGANFLCFSTGVMRGHTDLSLKYIKIKIDNMLGIATRADIKNVMICEFQVSSQEIQSLSPEEYSAQILSIRKDPQFQNDEKEIYLKSISELKDYLHGFNIYWDFPGYLAIKNQKAEEEVKEGFGMWK